ncbi:MAG TPA: hypothetical protein VH372_11440 [Actinospica sp.]|nr:hypothetical protein [Actinospica sp.]
MESDATVPPEQALTDALLALSWPLPRTVEDADAALTRLEEVRAVLTRLEQQSVGSEAWWAGQVDALATQSGFVLEWWRPVLRDPELDWTLNHQAHLTADLATLASAGARLLDQMEPRAAEQAAAVHARRAAEEHRWGPAAVPPFVPTTGPNVPGARPQPPAEVFGDIAAGATAAGLPVGAAAGPAAPQPVSAAPAEPPAAYAPVSDDLEPPQFPPLPADPGANEPPPPEALNAGAARHRRPSYDFDDPDAPLPVPVIPAPVPVPAPSGAWAQQPGPPTRGPGPGGPGSRGPGSGGPVPAGAPPGQGPYPGALPPGYPPPAGFRPGDADDDDDEPGSLVPTALARHQRRLLLQTAAILAAIGVLCWWAVYTLASGSSHPSAGSTAHSTGVPTAQDGVGVPPGTGHASPTASPSAPSGPGTRPATSAAPAPSTATSSVPDGTAVSSVRVTLLGGSGQVPQIVALITVQTAGTGAVNVSGSYYGAKSGGAKVAAETDRWTFSGKTAYQYSVPIANSAYCGTTFTFTLSAGGRSDTQTTSPGC